jgi:transcriptional antiterminator RfaH
LSEEVITEVQSREDERGIVALSAKCDFVSGDKVRIIEGALSEHVGLFDCADARRRVFVLLDLLGREVKVRLPMEAIASCG